MSQDQSTEINELWLSMARAVFPKESDDYLIEMKMIAVSQWLIGIDNERTKLYDQFVVMKRLKDLKGWRPEDED